MVIELNILHERAMEVIRYLEKVKDIEVLSPSQSEQPSKTLSDETSAGTRRKPRIGIVGDHPNEDTLTYTDRVRTVTAVEEAPTKEGIYRTTDEASSQKRLVKRDWYGILADHPDKDAMTEYFDNIRDEWEDRY